MNADETDLRRVAVVGTSCSGKTTFAAALAAGLQVPHVELDALHWRPGWVPAPREAFRQAVAEAIAADRWVLLREQLYGGNRESFRQAVLSRDSILWWVVTTWGRRREYPELFEQAAFAHLEVVTLSNPRQADAFLHRRLRDPGAAP